MRSSTTIASINTPQRRRFLVFLTFFFFASFLPVLAAGEEGGTNIPPPKDGGPQETSDETSALADIFVNGQKIGSVNFFLDPDQHPLLPSSVLRATLVQIVRPEILVKIAAGEHLVTVKELNEVGIGLAFDMEELKLSLTVPPAIMNPVELWSTQSAASELAGETKVQEAKFAATLGLSGTLSPTILTSPTDPTTFTPDFSLEISPALRAFETIAEADVDLTYTGAFSATANSARLVRDFPELGARLAAGIVTAQTVGLQSTESLIGLYFGRESMFPVVQQSTRRVLDEFVLERDADVTVQVNGIVIRKLHLEPGTYRLSDLPLSSGLNEVDVTIVEDGKAPRTATLGLPYETGLLQRGQLDYSVALGADKDYPDEPFGSGYISLGLGHELQANADAEAGYGIAMGGLSALWASVAGTFGLSSEISLGYSGGQEPSPAFGEELYWRYYLPKERYIPRLGAAIEYMSPDFTAPRSDLTANPPATMSKWSFSAQGNESLPMGGSFSALADITLEEGTFYEYSFTIGALIPVRNYTSLNLSGGADWSQSSGFVPRLSLSLLISPADRRNIIFTEDAANHTDSLDLSADLDEDGNKSISASGQGLATEGVDRSISLTGKMKTEVGDYAVSGQYYHEESDSSSQATASISASTNLVFADGNYGIADSIGDATALLVPSSSASKERLELKLTNGADISLDQGNTKVVRDLYPYEPFSAAIEMPDSDPDRRPDPSAIAFTPAYRSITVVKVGIASSVAVGGRLVDESGAPRKNLSGDILDSSGKTIPYSGTFTDDDGAFECFGLSNGEAAIKWSDGSVSKFTVPAGEPGAFFDIGDIVASAPEASGDGGTQ